MRWLTGLTVVLVFVATPAVIVAAVMFLPVGWLAIGGLAFVLVGTFFALRAREHRHRAVRR